MTAGCATTRQLRARLSMGPCGAVVRLCRHEDASTARAGDRGCPHGGGRRLPAARPQGWNPSSAAEHDRAGPDALRCRPLRGRVRGEVPPAVPADGDIDWGVCTARFSGADGRVVYRVGHPFSEWSGRPRSCAMHPGPGMWRASRSIHPSAPDGGEGGGRQPEGVQARPVFGAPARRVLMAAGYAVELSPLIHPGGMGCTNGLRQP
jgi:hypothetical protein